MNGYLLVDKPAGPTSNDVLGRFKKLLGTKKLGHTGTLDPFATGLLTIAVGEGLKYIQYLQEEPKVYEATLLLGTQTDTLDCQGQVTAESTVPKMDLQGVQRVATTFLGQQLQIPPMYSAKKIGGQALYKLARAGEVIERQPCKVFISSFEILSYEQDVIRFRAACSRGTYIRSLGSDLATALGTCGHLTQLRRLSVGSFHVDQDEVVSAHSTSLDNFDQYRTLRGTILNRPEFDAGKNNPIVGPEEPSFFRYKSRMPLVEISKALKHFDSLELDSEQSQKLQQGKVLKLPVSPGIYQALLAGQFLGLVESCGQSVKALRMMSTNTSNFYTQSSTISCGA